MRSEYVSAQRVAQYVRMSTDMQEYSILNQKDTIARYASAHGMRVVKTYMDEGKSGLHLKGRSGLKQLIRDVHDERRTFSAILVYDVSRWGRFQDTDESAYYDYVCKRAGVPIIYCAELFEGEPATPLTAVMKSIKRAMAAEFSRELGDKVYASKMRVSRLGFRAGSAAPFGLQRLVVDSRGRSRGVLPPGEGKLIKTDRVVLTKGLRGEVNAVRSIFRWCADEGLTTTQIADRLNRRQIGKQRGKARWYPADVGTVIRREAYAGKTHYNKTTARLGAKKRVNAKELWVEVPVRPALVSRDCYVRANQQLSSRRQPRYSDDELVDRLRALLRRRGRLDLNIINGAAGVPHGLTYARRFGSLYNAYRLVGYKSSTCSCLDVRAENAISRKIQGRKLLSSAAYALQIAGFPCNPDPRWGKVVVAGETVAVVCRRPDRKGHMPSVNKTALCGRIALVGAILGRDVGPSLFFVFDRTVKRGHWQFDRLHDALTCLVARVRRVARR